MSESTHVLKATICIVPSTMCIHVTMVTATPYNVTMVTATPHVTVLVNLMAFLRNLYYNPSPWGMCMGMCTQLPRGAFVWFSYSACSCRGMVSSVVRASTVRTSLASVGDDNQLYNNSNK